MASDESIVVASLLAQLTAEKRRGVSAENEADGHPKMPILNVFFFAGLSGFIQKQKPYQCCKTQIDIPLSEFVVKVIL